MQVPRSVAPFQHKSAHLGCYPTPGEQFTLFTRAQASYPQFRGPAGWPSYVRASGPPVHHMCEGCTLPLAVLEAVKIKQIKHLRRHEEHMQEWLLGGFTDRTRSPIHSSSIHRNLITCFSLALCFTPNNYTLVRSTKKAHAAFQCFTNSYALISELGISGVTELSPHCPIWPGQSTQCEAVR